MAYNADTHKQCNKCKEVKERGEFYNHKCNKDKITGSCKICITIQSREWAKNNKERVKEHQRKRKPQYRKEYSKKWREENRDKIKQNKENEQ